MAVVLCLVLAAMRPLAAAQLFDIHLTAQGKETSVTVDLSAPMSFRTVLDPAGRVLLEFETAALRPAETVSKGLGLIRSFHAEPMPHGGVRLVLDLASPAVIAAVHSQPTRAVVELTASSAEAMRIAAAAYDKSGRGLSAQARGPDAIGALIVPRTSGPPEKSAVVPVVTVASPLPAAGSHSSIASFISPKRTIVIDAGHGGIDPGAESVAGYHEKEITLATARLLRRALEETGRYKVVLTRDSDTYLKLHERVARARAAHGDLFVSLHADSVSSNGDRTTRGASIYTLSETASDVESERYAQRENRADAIGGVDLGDQSDDVAGILVDLTVRETVNDGNRLAGMMVDALEHRSVSLLPNAPHRSAGFAVLKSPDIPSILIEMGYLSDIGDARALADPRHQAQIANAIVDGIDRYFAWLQVSRS